MASGGSAPGPGAGQMNLKNKFTVAVCFAFMIMQLMNDGVAGAGADDAHAKPTFMHLPMRLRNPRGVELSHQGETTSNPVHLPELHNQRGTEESDSVPVPEDLANIFQDDNTIPRFAHLPQHMHDPRGAHVPRSREGRNADQVESATPEANQVRFSHLPRLHNPRGVNVVKQIQERMNEEIGRQAGDEGDKS